ncbi:unnamed protein product [Callosobruchus maculatus]|uniref:Uncharacterized protein n=1 Tax=Callosobruchus maculatus TaxID=64391 RepID=A0A653BHW9_CALMS|nr:unnamed protein product [Callosobruchus maculatus]
MLSLLNLTCSSTPSIEPPVLVVLNAYPTISSSSPLYNHPHPWLHSIKGNSSASKQPMTKTSSTTTNKEWIASSLSII